MELLIIPSVLAISIKIGIFMRYHQSLRRENLDLGIFFLAVFFLNLFEMLSIQTDFASDTSLLILLAYYCCVIFTIHGFLNVALTYSQYDRETPRIKLALNLILAGLICGMFFTRGIIAGVEPMNSFTLTRIPGDFYWMFQLYLLGGLSAAVALLIRGILHADSSFARQKCMVVLIAAATPVLMASSVVALMAFGIQVNGAIFMSLALSIMLGLMVFAEEKTRLFRLLTIMPYTRERRLHKQLLQQITDCVSISDDPNDQAINLKQIMKDLEGSVVEHVLGYYDGNQKKAANALGVSEATLSRRARSCQQKRYKDSVRITENATSS
jgi:DNA-binding protein Fis